MKAFIHKGFSDFCDAPQKRPQGIIWKGLVGLAMEGQKRGLKSEI